MHRPGKTLVVGCEGFVGRGFYNTYRSFYPDTIGTHYRGAGSIYKLDLLAPDLSDLQLKKGEYKYALIAAANTDLTLCEKEKGASFRRNVEGILGLVRLLVQAGIQPILFSTAYVFDGVLGNYDELSEKNPINEYGNQKRILEESIEKICGQNYLMIRCSKVFDLTKGGRTLIDQMCSSLSDKKAITAAYDQVFSPLLLEDLISAVMALQIKGCNGLYNLCGPETLSRFELARQVAAVLGVSSHLIVPVSLDEVNMPYRMPKRLNLNCTKLHSCVNISTTPLSFCIKKITERYLEEAKNEAISPSR